MVLVSVLMSTGMLPFAVPVFGVGKSSGLKLYAEGLKTLARPRNLELEKIPRLNMWGRDIGLFNRFYPRSEIPPVSPP